VKRISIDNSSRTPSAEETRSPSAEEPAGPNAGEPERPSPEGSGSHPRVDPPARPRRQRRPLAAPGARRSVLGVSVAMIGGALIAVGTFLPWLEFNGRVRSGWEVFELYRSVGTNPAVISPMFGGGDYDIFFTGIITLSLAVLSLLLMAALLAIQKKDSPKRARRMLVLTAFATLAVVAALVVTAVNLRTAQLGTLAFERAGVHYGLWVTLAASWAGTLGMVVSITAKRWRMPERADREPLAAAPGQTTSRFAQPAAATASATSAAGETISGVELVISALKPPAPRSQPAKAPSRAGSPGEGLVRALALILFLVGFGGFVVAAAANQSIERTAASDSRALGQRDAAAASATLRTGFTSVNSAFNTYVATSQAVARSRKDVTSRLNAVAALSKSGKAGLTQVKRDLARALDAHAVAVEEEKLARKAYADQLAVLMKDVHP